MIFRPHPAEMSETCTRSSGPNFDLFRSGPSRARYLHARPPAGNGIWNQFVPECSAKTVVIMQMGGEN
jgi:hypothetical protein